MGKNKNNYAVWSARIKKQTSNKFKKIGSSINVDKRLYKEDIKGSVVHTEMLYKQKIISLKVKDKILWGLNRIKNEIENTKVKDLVKDIEYTSVDQKGNTFHLLANSGRSNINNSDILDLINVKGKITSEKRDTIYIVSDFAQYNSLNLNSKFYKNVIINYQDKEITCVNFDIDMETNKAMAYNDVLITDPKSKMKAGIVEFDLKTKDININPESAIEKIEVVTN